MIGIIAIFLVFGQLASSAPTTFYYLPPEGFEISPQDSSIFYPNWFTTTPPKYVPKVSSNMLEGLMTKLGMYSTISGLSEYGKMELYQYLGTKNLGELEELALGYDARISAAKREMSQELEELAPKDPEEIDQIWKGGILENGEIVGISQEQMMMDEWENEDKMRNNLLGMPKNDMGRLKRLMDFREIAEKKMEELRNKEE